MPHPEEQHIKEMIERSGQKLHRKIEALEKRVAKLEQKRKQAKSAKSNPQ
jgi:polyhydroxyalkanoate synthesis regulator phasin